MHVITTNFASSAVKLPGSVKVGVTSHVIKAVTSFNRAFALTIANISLLRNGTMAPIAKRLDVSRDAFAKRIGRLSAKKQGQ